MIQVDFIPYTRLKKMKFQEERIVAGIGVFDGVHLGHQFLVKKIIETGRCLGCKSTVITFYPPTRFLLGKNRYLLTTNLEKIKLFEGLGIERVIIFEFTEEFSRLSPFEFLDIIRHLNIKVLYAGLDFRFGYKREGDIKLMKEVLASSNTEVRSVDIFSLKGEKIGSTRIKEFILNGNIEEANRYLGYPFFMTGIPYSRERRERDVVLVTHLNKIKPVDGIYNVFVGGMGKMFIEVKKGRIHIPKEMILFNKNIMEISFFRKEQKAIKNRIWEFTDRKFYAKLY